MRKVMVLGILLLILLAGCSTETTLTTVTNLVNNYLEALETNDISC